MAMPEVTTLCYLKRDHQYLMMHRVLKKNDVNRDKWIGIGGHVETDESPEECLLREAREETGFTLTSYRMRGIVTFISGNGDFEYMFLYTADAWDDPGAGKRPPDTMPECDEGILTWVDIEDVYRLNIWQGDKIFFRLIDEDAPFFSLKLVYDGNGTLKEALLDGRKCGIERGKPCKDM